VSRRLAREKMEKKEKKRGEKSKEEGPRLDVLDHGERRKKKEKDARKREHSTGGIADGGRLRGSICVGGEKEKGKTRRSSVDLLEKKEKGKRKRGEKRGTYRKFSTSLIFSP